jgi:serine/threonine-protein kinase
LPAQAGRYIIKEEIARGGMGVVLRAYDPDCSRPLAVKLLQSRHRADSALDRRFLEEARLTAQLQHPGVPPVHDIGRLEDGRPFFAMRLVKGQTLAQLLNARASPAEDLPRFLGIFEQVCQAVAYAHSRGVIHRDLKPSNVMVGAFGEVQVMDWGLAKLLNAGQSGEGSAALEEPSVVHDPCAETPEGATQPGSVLGTPAYMAPEQARGLAAELDERADVFGLGAMLCALLTGRPPYPGAADSARRQAAQGELTDAFARLDACGADPQLMWLARACLAPDREARPGDAGAVAEAVAAYQAGVRERLRAAELERARFEIKAQEERKRRRLTVGLAAAVLLLVLTAAGALWWLERQRLARQAERGREERDRAQAIRLALDRARQLRDQARAAPPGELARYAEALAAVQQAEALARGEAVPVSLRNETRKARTEAEAELEEARRERQLFTRVLEIGGPRESPVLQSDPSGALMAEPNRDSEFAEAFRTYGWHVRTLRTEQAVQRMHGRPPTVAAEVAGALDEWAARRQKGGRFRGQWQRLVELARAIDPDPRRDEVRALLARSWLNPEWPGTGTDRELFAWVIPPSPAREDARARLRTLARAANPEREPVLGVLLLVRALTQAGDEAEAERLLRAAVRARPGDVRLRHALGHALESRRPPRWREAIECYEAARAVWPDLGLRLIHALHEAGRNKEALDLSLQLLRKHPNNYWVLINQALILHALGKLPQAEAALRRALVVRPDFSPALSNLGILLKRQGKLKEAEAFYRKAVAVPGATVAGFVSLGNLLSDQGRLREAETAMRAALALDDKEPTVLYNLGLVLARQKRPADAEAAYRKAIALHPEWYLPYNNLALQLTEQGKLAEAELTYRKAIALKPDFPESLRNLAALLLRQNKKEEAEALYRKSLVIDPRSPMAHFYVGSFLQRRGQAKEAEDHYRKAVALKPGFAEAYYNLGNLLARQGRARAAECETAFRKAVAHKPDFAEALCNLGLALVRQGRFAEALGHLERGHELGSRHAGWYYPSATWLAAARQMRDHDRKLSAVLDGETSPAGAAEQLVFAEICYEVRALYAAAARFYAEAFAARPKLARDLLARHRLKAAAAAALAAAGQGKDADRLDAAQRTRWRKQALDWLRADLSGWAEVFVKGTPMERRAVQLVCAALQKEPDLAGVRDPQALQRLSETEASAWRKFWIEVEELRSRPVGMDK